MPGDYYFEEEIGVFITAYWGEVSLVDILDVILRRAHDPRLQSATANLIDLSSATWVEAPPTFLREQVERLRPALGPPKARTVFVAPGELFYGLARMYAIVQIIYGGASVEVVRSWGAAAKLLAVDLEQAEAWARGHTR